MAAAPRSGVSPRGVAEVATTAIANRSGIVFKLSMRLRVFVGEGSPNHERFLNLKSYWFWSLRERFQAGQVKGLSDERTVSHSH
jgi:hypothetical protein